MNVLAVAIAVVAVFLLIRWLGAKREAADAQSAVDRLRADISTLQASISRLAKFEKIADADEAAQRLLADARVEAERIARDAAAAVDSAQREAQTIRSGADERATAIVADATRQRSDAERAAKVIIDEANAKAEDIAGDALKALSEAKDLEKTVAALNNIIDGYGDRYIVPTHALLDDLAEGLGHTEAGQKLKAVRDRIRESVKAGKAATCDYVEENRRTTAIRFVVDAFNGKADSILAKAKQDNYGTLRQELRDAFALVNHNGRAFRDARILDSYLTLREEELKWATVAHELREREREEQRRIKEQIREEEKARKEYERALRETAKEEEVLRKAMAKAEEQLAKATEEQRAEYEGKLQALQSKLQEAEERNKRALSMAQQTKRGHVYVISNVGSFGEHVYKIGLTRRLEPLDRIRELSDSSVPFEFDVHALVFSEDAPALETQLHRHFLLRQINKVNHRKEFFGVSLVDIRQEMEGLGLTASWTMTAAAREYRESEAIEQAIVKDPLAREAWLKRQLQLDPVSDLPEPTEAI